MQISTYIININLDKNDNMYSVKASRASNQGIPCLYRIVLEEFQYKYENKIMKTLFALMTK